MPSCFPHWEIFFSSGLIWSDSMRFKFPLSPNTFEGKQDQAQLKYEGETSSFLLLFHTCPDTRQHLLWLESGTSLIYEGLHLPHFYSHYSHYLGLWNYLLISEHLCYFTTSCLHPHSFFWLQYHDGSSRQFLFIFMIWFKHLPMKSPFSASLQGNVVHSFFCVTL